jgi:hypothetical protein
LLLAGFSKEKTRFYRKRKKETGRNTKGTFKNLRKGMSKILSATV